MEQKYQRKPTISEIAEELDIPEYKVEAILKMNSKELSMDATLSDDEDVTLLETIVPDDEVATDEELTNESDGAAIQRSMMILSEKERQIVNLYFGIGTNHSYTLEEIGYMFDLTRERVRQIKEKAIKN